MDLKEVEKVVAKIQGQLFKNSNAYSIGMLKSHFRGSGLQFKEHQIYCHGDDVRFIDWKLYARTSTPYIKTFEEERNVEITVIIDLSLGMLIGYKGETKLKAAINISCLLSLLVGETNDYVQFVLFGEEDRVLPKSSGKKAIVQLVGELRRLGVMKGDGTINMSYRPHKEVSQEKKITIINRFIKQKKEVVILSDFNDLVDNKDLRQLGQSRRTHCFRIISPIDREQKVRFSVYGFNSSEVSRVESGLTSLKKGGKTIDLIQKLPINIRNVDIEGRYLEDFIRELM